ncbi:MAG: glycerophosphoryl diester phosphodiesterase, partial [Chitinophagaceae bacterium]|nr:glycerophosphoryl diester phosphodiesterase [Chitinophagaceae bacterium]
MRKYLLCLLVFTKIVAHAQSPKELSMVNDRLRITWTQTSSGWKIKKMEVKKKSGWITIENPSGENTLIYSRQKPESTPDTSFKTVNEVSFPEPNYLYQVAQWRESISPVSLNTEGNVLHFLPTKATEIEKNNLSFQYQSEVGIITSEWKLNPLFPQDIQVTQTLRVKKAGHYSMTSPTLYSVPEEKLTWATVPGYFQGNKIQKNFALAYTYGHGVPSLPVVYRERCATTLCPLVSSANGITFSVIPDPGLAMDPWASDSMTLKEWRLGLSHKNRRSQLSPTLYYPVLGESGSLLKAGDVIRFKFTYSFTEEGWFASLNHAIYDIYKFKETLNLRQSKQSLTSRTEQMHTYLTDGTTSKWNLEDYNGLRIGAQSYLGGVIGENKDAMKNSDYGAMWMMAATTNDTILTRQRLPYALNFKLAQQQTEDSFFQGAVMGQYYLAKSKRFSEEWGEVVEPIAVTYYTMLDMGNILLFEPDNSTLKNRQKLGAEALIRWQ